MLQKIVIASDSFKGSLRSQQVADAAGRACRRVLGDTVEVIKIPVADGGEGTMEALVPALGGEWITANVHDPLMRTIEAKYGIIHANTAVIEMAVAGGLTLLTPEERNPMRTSTYGVGELMADALQRGCRKFLIGIGGSATNDAGVGMLQALGVRFLEESGKPVGAGGKELIRIDSIDDSQVLPALRDAQFTIACDVANPFSGSNGAAHIFAPQKGADAQMVEELDKGLKHFSALVKKMKNINLETIAGAGAAGGLGGGMLAFLPAQLERGIEMVLDALDFDRRIAGAGLVITGEGKLDAQTALGKTPTGVLRRAQQQHIPVIAIGGAIEHVEQLNELGFAAVFSILPAPVSLEKAMDSSYASGNVERIVEQILKAITCF